MIAFDTKFSVAEVREILLRVFPNAKPQHSPQGNTPLAPSDWLETIDVGFFRIKLHAYQSALNKRSVGDIVVEILAVRVSTDSSGALIWGKTISGLDGLEPLLSEVREHLLGIAAGITYLSGVSKGVQTQTVPKGVQNSKRMKDYSLVATGLHDEPGIDEALEAFAQAPVRKLSGPMNGGKPPPTPPVVPPLPKDISDLSFEDMFEEEAEKQAALRRNKNG